MGRADGKANHILPISLADDDGFAFVPIQISTPQVAGFMHAQAGIRKRQKEGSITKVDQSFVAFQKAG